MERPRLLCLILLLGAGCAAPGPPDDPLDAPPHPSFSADPLDGLPVQVAMERALVVLEEEEGPAAQRARSLLLSLPVEEFAAIRVRAMAEPVGSLRRRTLLSLLLERGQPLPDWPVDEVVDACLREIRRTGPAPPRVLAIAHLRMLGDRALPQLYAATLRGDATAASARAVLTALHGTPCAGAEGP